MGELTRAGRGASQRRSRERREQLLRAALGLLQSGGAKAVTHRAVSDAAGLPPATAGYYFPAVNDLFTAAIAFHAQERLAQLRAMDESARGHSPLSPLEMARETAVRIAEGRAFIAISDYEVFLEAARDPAFRPVAAAARQDLERLFISYFTDIGATNVIHATRAHLALIDGFALQQLAFGSRSVAVDMATNAFAALFAYHRTTDAERERIRDELRAPLPAALQPPRRVSGLSGFGPGSIPSAHGRGASQQRSRERREQLLTSAIELFEAGGSKAITHRAVSQAAHLPPATAGYYFPMIDDLLTEAVEFHVRGRLDTIASMLEAVRDMVASPLDLLELSSRALAQGGSGVGTTHFELFLEAARNPGFRPIAAAARRDFEAIAVDYVAQLGVRDVLRAAQIYLAFTDGLALQRLAFGGGDEADIAMMVDSLVGLVYFYRSGDTEQDDIRESLLTQRPARRRRTTPQ